MPSDILFWLVINDEAAQGEQPWDHFCFILAPEEAGAEGKSVEEEENSAEKKKGKKSNQSILATFSRLVKGLIRVIKSLMKTFLGPTCTLAERIENAMTSP